MRVKSLAISGFRAFSDEVRLDLDGDVVLVVGANGQGKTSLFDAILWAFTGAISRIEDPEAIVSLYSNSGEAQVEVTIASDSDPDMLVHRRQDGHRSRLYVKDGEQEFHGEEAEHKLIRRLWPEGLRATEPRGALRVAMERGVYLQQDVLTGFLTADTDSERFNAITEIMGAGLVTDLQVSLENSRRTWSRATNQLKAQATEIEARRVRLEGQLRETTETPPNVGVHQSEWTSWWTQAMGVGVSQLSIPTVDSSDAHVALDSAMSELRTIRLSRERRGEDLRGLLEIVPELSPSPPNLPELLQATEVSRAALSAARKPWPMQSRKSQKSVGVKWRHALNRKNSECLPKLHFDTFRSFAQFVNRLMTRKRHASVSTL